jgi:hypothetical protein
MTTSTSIPTAHRAPLADPLIDIVIPVYNEERGLASSVRRVRAFLDAGGLPYRSRLTIADNASTDGTLAVAEALAAELPGVVVVDLPAKGRGGALNQVWSASDADVLAYLDVDLSTDLAALLPLVSALVSGHSDVAIGSRLGPRGPGGPRAPARVHLALLQPDPPDGTARRFSDAQCGFKAVRADVAHELLPLVLDTGWCRVRAELPRGALPLGAIGTALSRRPLRAAA